MAIEKHINSIVCSIDKNKYTLSLYLDFQKAFDVIDIDILIEKFKKYGIGGLALAWLISFSKCRKQAVKINGTCSIILELKYIRAKYCLLMIKPQKGSGLKNIYLYYYKNVYTIMSLWASLAHRRWRQYVQTCCLLSYDLPISFHMFHSISSLFLLLYTDPFWPS